MIRKEEKKLHVPICVLYPGELYVTKEKCILNTVVGSCVVVCLYDGSRGLGGMEHFIVPGTLGTETIISDQIAEHGIIRLEYIMAEIVKAGGDRRDLKAKIFGAGFLDDKEVDMQVIRSNIKFIHEYFTLEKIPIVKEDLGGNFRREIMFEPYSGKVFRRVLKNNSVSSEFIKLEKKYVEDAFQHVEIKTDYVLFD